MHVACNGHENVIEKKRRRKLLKICPLQATGIAVSPQSGVTRVKN